jgi:hypothetical protein
MPIVIHDLDDCNLFPVSVLLAISFECITVSALTIGCIAYFMCCSVTDRTDP